MNKTTTLFIVLLFLYLLCSFEPISSVEKSLSNELMEHNEHYENPERPEESKKTKNSIKSKIFSDIKKINKILGHDGLLLKLLKIENNNFKE
ncbi:hypothetical protein [Methanobrevibacter arboriphilus]|uniref:hypothetical protein n=1 Tax=Methanobrevibacter arboriphilus TaxID=39441 RepID=UPI0012DDE543|nr:hypothetical protein [Methanobrevibacter arboriphilus]